MRPSLAQAPEVENPRLTLSEGSVPRPVALVTVALAALVAAFALGALVRLGAAQAAPLSMVPFAVALLFCAVFVAAGLLVPNRSTLTIDAQLGQAALERRGLVWRHVQHWPLAALPPPEVIYDDAKHRDSLPSWELRIALPGPSARARHFDARFYFRGAPSVAAHIEREKAMAEALQARMGAMIAAAREGATHPAP